MKDEYETIAFVLIYIAAGLSILGGILYIYWMIWG